MRILNQLKGLFSKENTDFIRETYRQLLNRPPNVQEITRHSQQLSHGISKFEIFKSVLNSPEAIYLFQLPIVKLNSYPSIADIVRTFFASDFSTFVRQAYKEIHNFELQGRDAGKIQPLSVGIQRTNFIANLIERSHQLSVLIRPGIVQHPVQKTGNSPTEFYSTVMQWVTESNLFHNIRMIYPEEKIVGIKPKNVDPSITLDYVSKNSNKAFVTIIPQGMYSWTNGGSVLTPNGKLIKDISHEMHGMLSSFSTGKRGYAVPQYLEENIAVLHSYFEDNYFHWMFDVAGRLDLLRKSGIPIDRYIIASSLPFQAETLALLGIPPEKRIEPVKELEIRANHLIVPTFTDCIKGVVPKWVCDFLRTELLLNRNVESLPEYKRIYISRSEAKHRKVINENEVMNILMNHGFKRIVLESLSVPEKIQVFRSAEVIIAPHGAGLTNLIFCQAGTKVIEFFNPNWMLPCYRMVSDHYGLDYYYLVGDGNRLASRIDFGKIFDDIYVNPYLLVKTLELASV